MSINGIPIYNLDWAMEYIPRYNYRIMETGVGLSFSFPKGK